MRRTDLQTQTQLAELLSQHKTVAEIAAIMDVTPGAASGMVFRYRQRQRQTAIAEAPALRVVEAVPPPPVLAQLPPEPVARVGRATCCWPTGDVGAPDFRFCGDLALLGKSYCQRHHEMAWVKPIRKRA
jgi:GcrA cell cycle regulator